jgi:hypothetical protein
MRTADEIFQHHLEAFGAGNIEEILLDYHEISVIMYGEKIWRGVEGARVFFDMWLSDLIPAGSDFNLISRVSSGDMVCITWSAESAKYNFDFGTDTFVFKEDKVLRQTVATRHWVKE